ncbi:MAG: hypothetical protein V4564_14425 [Pseudomonadota bacterium]
MNMRFGVMMALIVSGAYAPGAFASEKARKVVKIVKIGGASFKVVQRGNDAEVSRQSLIVKLNAEHYALAARAAEYASGCVVDSAYTEGPAYSRDKLQVVLNCASKSAPAPAGVEVSDR